MHNQILVIAATGLLVVKQGYAEVMGPPEEEPDYTKAEGVGERDEGIDGR